MKNNNSFTINLNDDYKRLIAILSEYYQRKPADLLRLLIIPALHNAYASMQRDQHNENKNTPTQAHFIKDDVYFK